jgi:hypothetical protein
MGFFNDFLGNFTGGQSRGDLTRAKGLSDAALKEGYDTGRSDYEGAIGRFDPYATGGGAAYKRYLDSLGVNGAEAQGAVEQGYLADPIQNQLMDRITKANTRAYTARGMSNSGAATQSLTNQLLANWKGYQDQLSGAGGTGFQAATGQAGIQRGEGDMAYGYGATRAGNEINYGNALAASRNTGINNLFKLGGLAVQGAKAMA